ncbi:MAG: response regulator [Brasilonema angustatum HA4187-MV1]|jgi:CheY-like chemotaxis protein|nr:response regulator [Brasilonema angustatum HA4187-MV1]
MVFSTKQRILVVDDVPNNIYLLQTILEAEEFEVDTALNGLLALTKIQASPPDLVLLDVMMPVMNGFEVTKSIRQNDKLRFLPILLITAGNDSDGIEGLKIGANDFMRKPIKFDILMAKILNILR